MYIGRGTGVVLMQLHDHVNWDRQREKSSRRVLCHAYGAVTRE